jgi:hypothetical protein
MPSITLMYTPALMYTYAHQAPYAIAHIDTEKREGEGGDTSVVVLSCVSMHVHVCCMYVE